MVKRVEELDAALARVNEEIKREVETSENPFLGKAIELLQTIPGVGERVAQVIVSEIGVDIPKSNWSAKKVRNFESLKDLVIFRKSEI